MTGLQSDCYRLKRNKLEDMIIKRKNSNNSKRETIITATIFAITSTNKCYKQHPASMRDKKRKLAAASIELIILRMQDIINNKDYKIYYTSRSIHYE